MLTQYVLCMSLISDKELLISNNLYRGCNLKLGPLPIKPTQCKYNSYFGYKDHIILTQKLH